MKKGDFLAFSFFKKSKWMSIVIALIFLLNTCTPAWAREGNYGPTTSLGSFASGVLAGAITFVSCYIDPTAGAAGSIAGDLTGLFMYYYSYSDYGETWIRIGKMEISKGQVCSMVAGIVASAAASFVSGAASGAGNAAADGAANAAEGAAGTAGASAGSAAGSAAGSTVGSVATEASQGLISSVISSAIQLPVDLIKSVVNFFSDLFSEALDTALENLFVSLGGSFATFGETIALGFWTTCKDIWNFITDPVGSIKDMWEGITRKGGATANPYYRYGTEGAIDKALVNMGGDLGVGMIRMVSSEYVKQNLEDGIYIGGKKIIGPVDETIAGMVGSMVSNYIGASLNVMVMKSLGEICGWDVDAQAGFLSRGEVNPNATITVKVGDEEEEITVSELAGDSKLMNDVKNNNNLKGQTYTIKLNNGNTVKVQGDDILNGNPEIIDQLKGFNRGVEYRQEMTKSGSEVVGQGYTNRQERRNVSNEQLEKYQRISHTKDGRLLSAYANEDGIVEVPMEDGSTLTIDLNKSTINGNGQYTLAIINKQVNVSAQDLSNSGVTGNRTGKFAVRLKDNSTVTVTIDSKNSAKIQEAVNKYNTAMQGYAQTFGQYGALVMADPNRSIRVQVMDNKGKVSSRNISISELSSNNEIVAFSLKDKVLPEGLYEVTLKDNSRIYITAKSLNSQALGELKSYSVMLNSSYYSQLFKMTGGLMYNINGEDMNTKGVLRAGFEAVRNMGMAPVVATATRIALLKVMDYHTYYGVGKNRIYENLWKMALANAGANVVTEAFNNMDFLRETTYGLTPGNNPFQTRGSKSFLAHMANKTLEEAGGALSQIAWGYYCKKNNLNADALSEMAHLAGTSLVSGSIDALFRQDEGLGKTRKQVINENGEFVYENGQPVYESVTADVSKSLKGDKAYESRLSWDNLGESSTRFTKGVLGDIKNQFVEAALDTALVPYPLRSPGTGPNAFMNQWAVHDKVIQHVSTVAKGSSPIDADLMRFAPNANYRADANFAQSFSSAVSNRFMPADFRSYALFDNNGIMDYQVNRSLIEGIDFNLPENRDLKIALKKYVSELWNKAVKDRMEGRNNEASYKEDNALQLLQAIDKGTHSAVRSTYRGSRAGVAQDQFSYGNAIIADAALNGLTKEVRQSSYVLSELKSRMPFLEIEEEFDLPGVHGTKEERLKNIVDQLSRGVKMFAPNVSLLDYATVDQFGRLQNTYYYGSEYNGTGWEGVKLDKYTQYFYGPFGHQLSVTVDSTNIKPREKIAVYSPAWEKDVVVDIIPGTVENKISLENFKYLGKEYYKEQGQKIVDALALPEAEQKEALSKLGIITMNADEIKTKIETFLKDNPDRLKEINSLMRRSWHYLGCDTTKSVTAKGLATAEWNLVIMMMIMEGVTSDKDHKSWGQLTSDEQMHIYINSTNFSRYLTDVGYRVNGSTPQGSAIRDPKTGQLLNTAVECPECDGSKDRYKETPKTIFLPGYLSVTPDIQVMGKEKQERRLIGHEDGPTRGPNYSYDLSLYPTGSGFSPYAGPAYNVNAYEINSGPQLIARGVNQIQGTQAAEYRRFEGRSASGISAFSDQSALPQWSVDTGYEADGSLNSAQVKDYTYDANKIGREIAEKVDREKRSGNILQAKLLEAVQLHSIKDITGKEFTLVSGNNEDPNYYHAFYNAYNEASEKPAVVDNKNDLAKVNGNTTTSKTDMRKVEPLGIVLPEVVITAKSEEREIKPAGLEIIPKNKKITENATDVDRYAIEKGLLKTARDTGVLFKDQEALEQKFGVEPPKALAKEETIPAANTVNTQSMLFNTADNSLSFLSGESTAPVKNKTITTQEITPATTQENAVVDRYAIEKGLLKTARDTGVLFKDQEALEQKFGVEPPKALAKEETIPAANTVNTQSMLFNTADNSLSFLSGESTAPVENKTTITQPKSDVNKLELKELNRLPENPYQVNTKEIQPLKPILENSQIETLPVVSVPGVSDEARQAAINAGFMPNRGSSHSFKTPLTTSTNIGTDAVFLKSDFQTDAVKTSLVTDNAGYKQPNDTPNLPVISVPGVSDEARQAAINAGFVPTRGSSHNTTTSKTDMKKVEPLGIVLPEIVITAKSEEKEIKPLKAEFIPKKTEKIEELPYVDVPGVSNQARQAAISAGFIPADTQAQETTVDRYAIEKGLLKTARDTGVLFKDQEALEQKFGVEPSKALAKEETIPAANTANTQSILFNTGDNPVSFLTDESIAPVENKNIETAQEIIPPATRESSIDRYTIEKDILTKTREVSVPLKNQEYYERMLGFEPPKSIISEEATVPHSTSYDTQKSLLSKEHNLLFLQ